MNEFMYVFFFCFFFCGVGMMIKDWGGIIGLTLPLDENIRTCIKRAIVFNTGIPTGSSLGTGFLAWRNYVKKNPDMDIGKNLERASNKVFSTQERAAYDAPFPNVTYKAAVSAWPLMVPQTPDDD